MRRLSISTIVAQNRTRNKYYRNCKALMAFTTLALIVLCVVFCTPTSFQNTVIRVTNVRPLVHNSTAYSVAQVPRTFARARRANNFICHPLGSPQSSPRALGGPGGPRGPPRQRARGPKKFAGPWARACQIRSMLGKWYWSLDAGRLLIGK